MIAALHLYAQAHRGRQRSEARFDGTSLHH